MDHERIIYIYDYLSRYTDENHDVSQPNTRTPRQCLQSD